MTPEATKVLKELLYQEEGFRQFPYKDTAGKLTIGIGRNLIDKGISRDEAFSMLENDIIYFTHKLIENLPFFIELDDVRKIVLVDMCFNLGLNGFLQFKGMLSAVENHRWAEASYHILKSKAAIQAPSRYKELADMMFTGTLPIGYENENFPRIATAH